MKDLTVTAKYGTGDEAVSTVVVVKAPETIEEAIEQCGGEAVLSNALANWKVTVQAAIRRFKKAGKSDEEVQTALKDLKMGVALERVSDPKAAMLAKFAAMDAEGKAAFIKELTAKAQAAQRG